MDSVGGFATVGGASKILGETYWVLREYIKRNRISTVRLTGSQAVLVKLSDLAELKKPAKE